MSAAETEHPTKLYVPVKPLINEQIQSLRDRLSLAIAEERDRIHGPNLDLAGLIYQIQLVSQRRAERNPPQQALRLLLTRYSGPRLAHCTQGTVNAKEERRSVGALRS